EAEDGREAVDKALANGYDLYLLDMKMPRLSGLDALREIRAAYPDALAIMVTAFGSQRLAIEAVKAGAYDYFTKPFNIEELRIVLLRALERQRLLRQVHELQNRPPSGERVAGMVGESAAMRQVYSLVDRVAGHDVTVLITGESGTGKELVAQAIHAGSPRREGPFVTVNCAAIPEPLLESELFGHEKGAFTGATFARAGKFEAAGAGTILLDEIGEMPPALQAKLLRVLQEHEIERIGSNKPRPVDIRVLAATNRNLAEMVGAKSFREDLFFRINVVPIHIPPLRERMEDLPALAHFFVGVFNARFGKRVQGLTPEAMAVLERHAWPGNVRELENTIQRAVVMATGTLIEPAAFPDSLRAVPGNAGRTAPAMMGRGGVNGFHGLHPNGNGHTHGSTRPELSAGEIDYLLSRRIERITEIEECRVIKAALEATNGRRQETADLLGISRKSLHNKMIKYDLFERREGRPENGG
ncbi:MAG: sigma-54 dependent transcriptional regulator, partial [bacterium]|nr:sigma-54 dependent transcriptional regulator [bacterium]